MINYWLTYWLASVRTLQYQIVIEAGHPLCVHRGGWLLYSLGFRSGNKSLRCNGNIATKQVTRRWCARFNLSVILNHLRENAPISRAVLAEMTGLNKTTVSSLVSELIERQFVHEIGLESTHSGRSAGRLGMLLTLNPAAGCIVSAEIGVDFISVICTNFAPEVIWQHEETIDPEKGQGEIIQRTLALLNLAVAAGMKYCHTLLGIAVGVPGLVDLKSGTLLFAPNLKWRDTPLHDLLQDSFDAPLVVANEASMAALGEHYFGAARGYDEVLYISAGVGLGGGIVNHGRVYNGVSGFGGEFGHMTMVSGGELCNCGNRGCWETLVSQRALYRYVQEEIQQGYSSLLPHARRRVSKPPDCRYDRQCSRGRGCCGFARFEPSGGLSGHRDCLPGQRPQSRAGCLWRHPFPRPANTCCASSMEEMERRALRLEPRGNSRGPGSPRDPVPALWVAWPLSIRVYWLSRSAWVRQPIGSIPRWLITHPLVCNKRR